jgi:hypothetical protein
MLPVGDKGQKGERGRPELISGAGELRTDGAATVVLGGGGGGAGGRLLLPLGEHDSCLNLMTFRRPDDFGR